MASPQITPNTRARTSSGITRWTSVNAATSSTLFAAPTIASNRIAAARYGVGAISMIGAPQKISDQPNGEARLRPSSADCAESAEQSTRTDRGRQVADLGGAAVEHAERGDDDQDVQATAHERLRDDQGDEQSRPGHPRDRAEAVEDQIGRIGHRDRSTLDRDAHQQSDREQERNRSDGEDRADPRHGDEYPGDERSDQRAEALESSTLLRSPRSAPWAFERATAAAPAAPDGTASTRSRPRSRQPGRRSDCRPAHRPPTTKSAVEPMSVTPTRKRSRRKRSPSDAANGAITAAGSSRTSPATPTADVPPRW